MTGKLNGRDGGMGAKVTESTARGDELAGGKAAAWTVMSMLPVSRIPGT